MAGRIDPLAFKGIPLAGDATYDDLGRQGWNVSRGDTATPVATLSDPVLEANAARMAAFCVAHGVSLAPHAKTTLAADLLRLQARYGAWAMTVALPRQAALVWEQGFDRILLANEVTDVAAVAALVTRRDAVSGRELIVYADSARGVALLEAGAAGAGPPLDVLVELGHRGGRTGCRTVEDALAVARLVDSAPGLRLVGASGYEGTLASRRDEQAVTAVTGFLEKLRDFADALVGEGLVPDEAVVTAGGSIFFDTVIDVLGGWSIASRSRLVLRSGCYLIHDHGLYSAGTPIRHGVVDAPQFRPALSVWARVVSCPESGLALLDAGRRDVSHDAGLPVPLERWRDGESLSLHGERITGLSDQHAFLAWSGERDVREGDLVRLGISPPCTTLDRWRLLLRTDESYNVLGSVQTAF
jgi:D-serine deaminase-like pyridoxal phosphate-dependent protein